MLATQAFVLFDMLLYTFIRFYMLLIYKLSPQEQDRWSRVNRLYLRKPVKTFELLLSGNMLSFDVCGSAFNLQVEAVNPLCLWLN